mgnify:CR=1
MTSPLPFLVLLFLQTDSVYVDDGYFDPAIIRPEHLSSNRYAQTPTSGMVRGAIVSQEEQFRRRLEDYDTDGAEGNGVEQLDNCGSETDTGEDFLPSPYTYFLIQALPT